MRDYEFSFQALDNFSNSLPYSSFTENEKVLFSKLNDLKETLNFPAISNSIGSYIKFTMKDWRPKTVFEMGSGYGHSAFWYLCSNYDGLEKIYLTEKRKDLKVSFDELPWPTDWLEKLDYFQGDAFERLKDIESIDLCLIDGVKSDYLEFLNCVDSKMDSGAIVLIDNSYWRGSFLDSEVVSKKQSAKSIKDLHEFIKCSRSWESLFIPFVDGLSILRKV